MKKYIHSIKGKIPNIHKEVDIKLEGKNLIIIGSNGSGKTSFLREIHSEIYYLIAEKKLSVLDELEEKYENTKRYWNENTKKGTTDYDMYARAVKSQEDELLRNKLGLQIEIPNFLDFSSRYDDKTSLIEFFEATRKSNISHADRAKGLSTHKKEQQNALDDTNFGDSLEQHLLNLRNRRAYAISEECDGVLAAQITTWFEHFENQLKKLMEDDSTTLIFDYDTLKFSISQEGKDAYTFQTLSSGYMSIFDIYADLLMRSEYFDVTPDKLSGTVFIDEIDAHLHVSLQRLILPFFNDSFPEVQFIMTTHSPFVLMSVNDTVIFDLASNSTIDEDLSLYSYSTVLEGLLGTKSTSIILDKIIVDIAKNTNKKIVDKKQLEELIMKINPVEEKLDARDKAFYLLGVNTLIDMEDV